MMKISKNSLNRPFVRYGASTVVILLAFLLRQLLQRMTGEPLTPYVTFFPSVMLVAMLGGFWPGVFATLLSSFVTASWILSQRPARDPPVDQVSLGIFICAGFVMSVFADVYRETRNRAEAFEKELAVRESEAALQQSRERLQVTLSSIGDAVVSCDATGQITFMNPKAEEYVGWTTEAAAGSSHSAGAARGGRRHRQAGGGYCHAGAARAEPGAAGRSSGAGGQGRRRAFRSKAARRRSGTQPGS